MRIMITGFAAAIALTSVPALAETKPGTPTPAAGVESVEQAAVKDKRYCIQQTFTGSRVAKKICKTRAQWMTDDNFDPLDPK